jgi:hypothetical protein
VEALGELNEKSSKEQVQKVLDRIGPNFAIPQKTNILGDQIAFERATYGLRHTKRIQNDPKLKERCAQSEGKFSEFENRKAYLPPLLDNVTEGKIAILREDIIDKKHSAAEIPEFVNNIKTLCDKNKWVIVSSDKTKKNIVMSHKDYTRAGNNFLHGNKDYKWVKYTNIAKVAKKCNKFIDRLKSCCTISEHELEKCKVYYSREAEMFFTIKDHKKPNARGEFPVRPIGSIKDCVVKGIDLVLQKVLSTAMMKVKTNIVNCEQLLRAIDDINNNNDKPLQVVSLDVESLYPSIPCKKAIPKVVEFVYNMCIPAEYYNIPRGIFQEMLVYICENYFLKFGEQKYKQMNGVPMGARFAPPFAVIYMFDIEERALAKIPEPSILYGRYIDDVIYVRPENSQITNDELLNVFNSIEPEIKFTMENTIDGELPFLDCKLMVNTNKIEYKWYIKALHSGNLLNYHSHVPMRMKHDFIMGRFLCVLRRSSNDRYSTESVEKLTKLLENNEFPENMIRQNLRRAIKKYNTPPTENDNANREIFKTHMPLRIRFDNDTTYGTKTRTVKNNDLELVPVCSKTRKINTLGYRPKINNRCGTCVLCKFQKDIDCRATHLVYSYTCTICNESYVGRTITTMAARHGGHTGAIRNNKIKESALALHLNQCHEHVDNSKQNIPFRLKIITKCRDTADTMVAEALIIAERKPSINRKWEQLRLLNKRKPVSVLGGGGEISQQAAQQQHSHVDTREEPATPRDRPGRPLSIVEWCASSQPGSQTRTS